MLAEKYLPKYTVDDYMKWQGDWELIEGIPFAMAPSPFGKHQKVVAKISHYLLAQLENCENKEVSVYVELDWIVNDTTVVRPDVSVMCKDIEDYIKQPPEIVFEVVSKGSVVNDEEIKFNLYEKEKVKYYVLVYPNIKKVRGFKLINGKYEKFFDSDEGIIKFEICDKCQIEIDTAKIL